jgi:hypothetical protein
VKFLHVVRDGRDVAVSLRAASTGWARSWAPGSIGAAASLWRSMVLAARAAEGSHPGSYMEIRYEALQADGAGSLQSVLAFMGLGATPDEAAAICQRYTIERMQDGASPFDLPREFFREGRVGGWRDAMTAIDRYAFEAAAGDLLRELGYAQGDWWVERGYQRWALPALAAVGVRRRLLGRVRRWIASGVGASDA